MTKTSTMPTVTCITVDIFESEIKEFYVYIQSTKMFNKYEIQLHFKNNIEFALKKELISILKE